MKSFGERIKDLRNRKGMTQRQMAAHFGITERNYQRYEASDSPSNDTLIKFADFFEVSTDYLLGRIGEGEKPKQRPDESANKPMDDEAQRLQVIFDEPLQSYAVWLRNMGISISGGGQSGMVIAEIANDEYFDVSENVNSIMQMSKEHFGLLARQLGRKWPFEDEK